jgi:hypothetical protein
MKRLSIVAILIIALFTIPAFALDFTTTFTWEQNAEAIQTPPIIAGWEVQDVESQQIVQFPNTGGTGPFQGTTDFTFPAVPGDEVRSYIIRAVGVGGYETPWSTPMSKTYNITEAGVIKVPTWVSIE